LEFGDLYITPNLSAGLKRYFTASLYTQTVDNFKKIKYNWIIMNSLNSAQMILGIFISVATILSLTAAGVRWLVKHYFNDIKHELKPNGGSSLKDQVNRMEIQQTEFKHRLDEADQMRRDMNKKIDKMYDILIDYISKKG
jgi:hypothetical protein